MDGMRSLMRSHNQVKPDVKKVKRDTQGWGGGGGGVVGVGFWKRFTHEEVSSSKKQKDLGKSLTGNNDSGKDVQAKGIQMDVHRFFPRNGRH